MGGKTTIVEGQGRYRHRETRLEPTGSRYLMAPLNTILERQQAHMNLRRFHTDNRKHTTREITAQQMK